MSDLFYRYEKDGPEYGVKLSENHLAVRTRDGRPTIIGGKPATFWSTEAKLELQSTTPLFDEPFVGVQILQAEEVNMQRFRFTRSDKHARSVLPLLYEKDGSWALPTENVYIRFQADVARHDCKSILEDRGLQIKEKLSIAPNTWFASASEGTPIGVVFEAALLLLERAEVVYCYPELVRARQLRSVYPFQWHLARAEISGRSFDAHIDVEGAWSFAEGKGTTIAIIDRGFLGIRQHSQLRHKLVCPVRFVGKETRVGEISKATHGTHCAGAACATGEPNGYWAAGVAPSSRLMPISIPMDIGLGSIDEIRAFQWAADNNADVISCSWGPEDGTRRRAKLPPCTRDAIDYATRTGRGGKGCVVVFAAGNGDECVDLDEYASYRKVIAAGACNALGERAYYSDYGKALWCLAPSSGSDNLPGIWTTDPPGMMGDERRSSPRGDYYGDFGKTSASGAIVAGIAALIVSANPKLDWSEVKQIIANSCCRLSGLEYIHDRNDMTGYGRVDAHKALRLAMRSKEN